MDDNRAMTFQLETLRKENSTEHKEILSKLNILCTKVAVTDTKVGAVEKWQDDHDQHLDLHWGYIVALVFIAIGILADFLLSV